MSILSALRRVVPQDEELLNQKKPLALVPPQPVFPVRTVAIPTPASPETYNQPQTAPEPQGQSSILPQDSTMADLGAPPTMIQRNNKGRPVAILGGDNPIENNMELIRAQEGYKAPRSWKDQGLAFLTGGIPGGIDYATNQNTRNRWATGEDIQSEEGQINRELGLQGKEATIAAAKYRPVYQQQQLDARNTMIDQGQQRLDQGQQRVDQGQQRVDQGDTRLDRAAPVEVDIDGTKFQVPPQIAARLTSARSESAKNRTARSQNTDKLIAAIASRQDKQIASTIAQMGDPQEMYGAASDLWNQATEKERQANSMAVRSDADGAIKKQLLQEAAKLKETTVKLQQEARKAANANRGRSKAVKTVPSSGGSFNLKGWLTDHPNASQSEIQAMRTKAKARGLAVVE